MTPPLFETIELLDDPQPHSAPLNMALDEVLLRHAAMPLLRVYRWERPAVSFGYFEKIEPIEQAFPDHELVRRWTGGGVVPHCAHQENNANDDRADFTYSLILPKANRFAKMRSADSYHEIHLRITAALQQSGIDASLAANAAPKISQACFENPAQHDIIVSGKKIAGAAQRRSRFGALHQGSIQSVALPKNFPQILAAAFAEKTVAVPFPPFAISEAEKLSVEKYATSEWLRKF